GRPVGNLAGRNNTTPQYFAGLVDGDGCIGIEHYKRTNSYNIRVTVDMTDSRPIIELQKFFGGSIAQVNRKALTRKPTTYWRVSGKLAEKAILILQPFLLVKVEQAVIAL